MSDLSHKINNLLERSRSNVSKKDRTKILYEAFVLMNQASNEIDFSEFYQLVKEKKDDIVPFVVYLLYYSNEHIDDQERILYNKLIDITYELENKLKHHANNSNYV